MKIDPRNIYKLTGKVQHYAWGGFDFIPRLLGINNKEKKPFAEYWMGAHRSAPSLLAVEDATIALDKLFNEQPRLLGEKTLESFHQFPYLFKVLDVREMLSIQVHPTREGAATGFDEEEEKGIPLDAPNRNYKDRNHKPEVMIALSDFWLLHGFKQPDALKQSLNRVPQFRSLAGIFEKEGYRGLYQYVMELPQHEVDAILLPIVQKELKQRSFHESEKDEAGYWVGEYYLNKKAKNIDRGVFAIYLMNIVHLHPGQGIFQAAGVPHAYLQGQNMELMANSDNVLRGGLTNKHIDVAELMKHTTFEAVKPAILKGDINGSATDFSFPVDDFAISRIRLEKAHTYSATTSSAEIIFCIEGAGTISAANTLDIAMGEAVMVFAENQYELSTGDKACFFRAMVG